MSDPEALYIIQTMPTNQDGEYKYLGFEDLTTARGAETAVYEKRKAEESGLYAQVRVVKLCGFFTTELN